ncbi:MAG: hypothetical protein WBE72_16390 [Terracidiphilus sp.]
MGARVYLLAINSGAYAGPGIASSSSNASVSLLTTGAGQDSLGYYVTTDSNGVFTITGDYTCPTSYAYPYLYAVGGDAGSGNNSAITLVSPVEACPSSTESVIVNEVSTIAAVFSYAGFISDPTHVSSSGTALAITALNNAEFTQNNLVTIGTGAANTTTAGGNGTVPQATIYTLANILAACVNSTGSSSAPCATLFSNATNGSTAPTDTATAAVNIAHNPGANVAKLFALQGSSPAFVTDLASAPNDFTIGINFTQSSWFLNPHGVAVDGSGDVWVTAFGNGSFPEGGVGALLADSAWSSSNPITGGGLGYGDPQAIAISETVTGNNAASSGDVWVTVNANGTSLIQLGPSGSPTGGCASGCTETGLDGAYYEAIDSSGNGWQTSAGDYEGTNYLFEGVPSVGYSNFSGSCLTGGRGLAIDSSGNIWVANVPSSGSSYNLCEFSSTGTLNPDSPFSGTGMTEYANGAPIAIDASNNVWVGAYEDVAEFNSSGVLQSPSGGYTGGGVNTPYAIAIDGEGNVWTANNGNNSISEFGSSGTAISGSNGFTAGGILNGPNGLAIDGSGNVWVTAGTSNNLVEFVGAATPAVTPIAANLVTPYGAHAVNRP